MKIEAEEILTLPKELENEKTNYAENYKDEFDHQIIRRGISYYNKNNVLAVYKSKNKYYSQVVSDSTGQAYNVEINETDEGIEMECNCPYQDNCKHEYATLLAIDNCKIKEIELLPEVKFKSFDLHEILKKIPAEELKKFIVERTKKTRLVFSDIEYFSKVFSEYLPIQTEEYYYNHLYNVLTMKLNPYSLIYDYMIDIKKYIDYKNYKQAFIIIHSLVDAFYLVEKDASLEDLETGIIAKLGMYSRIVYRKTKDKEKINNWLKSLEEKEFFNDVYLEDMILTIK